MGSGQIVVLPPFFHHGPCLLRVTEPVLVQAFIPKLAIEALDVGVLRGFTWVDEVQLNPSLLSPAEHRLAGELRSVIHHYNLGQTGDFRQAVQDSRHSLAGYGGVYCYGRTLPAEVIYHGQGSEPAAVPQAVMNEVHRPVLQWTGE